MPTLHCRIRSKSRCGIIPAYAQAPIDGFSPGLSACVIAASFLLTLASQSNKMHRLAASLLSPSLRRWHDFTCRLVKNTPHAPGMLLRAISIG